MKEEKKKVSFVPQKNLEFCIRMIKENRKGISLSDEYWSLDDNTKAFLDKLMAINELF